jgi:hydrogenase maturation protease
VHQLRHAFPGPVGGDSPVTSLLAVAGRVDLGSPRHSNSVLVEVLICGSPDRGDDGAASVAASILSAALQPDVRLRIVGQLDIHDLLGVPAGAAVVVVDAATGIQPGRIVNLPLDGLIGGGDQVRPRSSHALAFPEVVRLAELIRGRPIRGRIVAIGAEKFALGGALSERVSAAIPALVQGVGDAVEQLRADSPAWAKD